MKNWITAAIVFFSAHASTQDHAVVWQTDVVKAVDISIKEKKPLLLFFTGSDWCGWCRRLQNEVFQKPQFLNWAKKNVILVELDFPRNKQLDPHLQKQNMDMAQMFGIMGYPTVWFVTASRNETQIVFGKLGSTGYLTGGPEVWLDTANKILISHP